MLKPGSQIVPVSLGLGFAITSLLFFHHRLVGLFLWSGGPRGWRGQGGRHRCLGRLFGVCGPIRYLGAGGGGGKPETQADRAKKICFHGQPVWLPPGSVVKSALAFAAKAAFTQSDVWLAIYPIIFSENISVAVIALAFKLLWSGVKMTGTET